MEAAERALLEATVRGALSAGGISADAASADAVLADVGWLEMLDAIPADAIAIVFNALGATNRSASVLDDVVVAALGRAPRTDQAVLLPAVGQWTPPGRLDGDVVHAVGLTTARAVDADELLVVCAAAAELRVVSVPRASVDLRPVRGIDPDAGLYLARVDADVDAHVDTGARLDAAQWDAAVALSRRALAHQISGASRTMLDLARTHALERVQFGRRIASFQAVRHRLAEALVAVEALEATLGAAADEPNPLTAALAKATAGRTAHSVATHCQQVLAGIGFTTDHAFHRFLKRTMMLDTVLGSADDIAIDVGRQLIDTRRVPTLTEL